MATGEAVTYIMAVVPSDAPLVLRLNGAIDTRVSTINPTPASPVSDPVDMAFIEIEGARLANTPVADVVKHRTADAVYGALSFGDPIVRTISVDIRYVPQRAATTVAATFALLAPTAAPPPAVRDPGTRGGSAPACTCPRVSWSR